MNIEVRSGAPLSQNTPCLVMPIFQGEKLSEHAAKLNKTLGGLVAEIVEQDGFNAALGETRLIYSAEKIAAPRVLMLGLGKREKLTIAALRKAAAKAARAVRTFKRGSFAIVAPEAAHLDNEDIGAALAEGIALGLYVFHDFKTDDETKKATRIENVTILAKSTTLAALKEGVAFGQLVARGNILARALVNLPSNLKSPQMLAEKAQEIAAQNDLRCEIWDENKIVEERMGALHGVGMGSDNPPRFIVLEYSPKGTEKQKPIILVGKGMTFDSGGYSLKPSTNMEDMKDDMGGAAVILGTMSAIKELAPNRRVLGIIPSAENMVNGHAQRPGDVVTARNGKTIEILNTDAEGRLILADALSYASEQNPALIVDFATLTGAIRIALGQEAAGLFSNDDELAARVSEAGEKSGERVWRFPMWDEYKEHIKGTISDVKNIGIERTAGSIAGAVFLEHFVEEGIAWAHIDIAAVAFIREDRPLSQRGATGFGVGLALQLLKAER